LPAIVRVLFQAPLQHTIQCRRRDIADRRRGTFENRGNHARGTAVGKAVFTDTEAGEIPAPPSGGLTLRSRYGLLREDLFTKAHNEGGYAQPHNSERRIDHSEAPYIKCKGGSDKDQKRG
jgi:hypothetical protein